MNETQDKEIASVKDVTNVEILKSNASMKEEDRDDSSNKSRRDGSEERDGQSSKRAQLKSRNKKSSQPSPHPSPQVSGYGAFHQPGAGRPPYHSAPGMHNGPRGHPPSSAPFPSSYYAGGDPYRGHPPPHYHQMPPMPHPGQQGPYAGAHGHYPPNLVGRPGPPPGYAHGYNGAYPTPAPMPMGYHGAPPPYPQNKGSHLMSQSSDSNSIASSKSRSTKNSRKKRTIEGVHSTKEKNPPVAYTFCRTDSSASSSTIATAANNTESHSMSEESPYKRERTSSPSSTKRISLSSTNIFSEDQFIRRSFSHTSSTSSVSVGGISMSSRSHNNNSIREAPKRHKGNDPAHLVVETGADLKSIFKKKGGDGPDTSQFQALSMNDSRSKSGESSNNNLFLSLSTSPINNGEVEATPASKNNTRKGAPKITIKTETAMEDDVKSSPERKALHDSPNPPIPGDTEMMTDEHMLNKHLRGQTFTPLPHLSDSGISPSNAFPGLGPQLSWSIAGDPSLEDLAACSWEDGEKDEKKRPGSTTSQLSNGRGIVISPHNFSLWKEEHESGHPKKGEDIKDTDSVRISMLSPHSEIAMAIEGTTTPLPWSFENVAEERENLHHTSDNKSRQRHGDHDLPHRNMFVNSGTHKQPHATPGYNLWSNGPPRDGLPPTPVFAGSKPPTPLFAGSNVGFARSPLHGDRRDWFGHPTPHNDRVRNLRGRIPPGAHMAPMPLHIPAAMASHHPLTSPMGIGPKAPMWSPHHGNMPPPMASPAHHMSPMDMSQSKRKCLPLKPPIPSKFQGDMDKMKGASVPEFTSLVNFPAHMSQKQSVNLPEGMRCCVMCGSACPCSTGAKKKGGNGPSNPKGNKAEGGTDKNGYAIIPTQNKGLCTLCDVNVWVVVNSGLEIKWCKGCKNFRPWAAFGDKGLATKCLRCRERQREKYALQKEEKEKARLMKGTVKAK